MRRSSAAFLIKEGFRNIVVNKLMSISSISVLFSCLIMIGSAFLLLVNVSSIVEGIENQNVIAVFYPDGVEGSPGDDLHKRILALDNVKSAEFVPNEEAYKESLAGAGAEIAELLGGDASIFPDSYRVTVTDMQRYSETVRELKALPGVESVRASEVLAQKLYNIRHTVTLISIGIIVLLFIVSLFIISNTIKITMFSRRLEIGIMRNVGATPWFIRLPFMLEGMILGIISGILATFAVWGIYELAIRALADLLTDIGERSSLPFSHYAPEIFCGFVALGIVTGSFGSFLAIAKYLKEKEFVMHEDK